MAGEAQRDEGFGAMRRRPSWETLALVVGLHALVFAGLIRAFAPDLSGLAVERATALTSVTVSIAPEPEVTPEPAPQPQPSPVPDEGEAAPEGPQASPRPVVAPEPRIVLPRPIVAPPVASTGTEDVAGAGESGAGTGAGGVGAGTGSGRSGTGTGSIVVTQPVKIAGDINDARDYPVPPGGREVRRGEHVIVHMTVGVDGRARNCRVIRPSPDPEADRITCRLAEERFRFRPAVDARGNPIEATYGWRQDWF